MALATRGMGPGATLAAMGFGLAVLVSDVVIPERIVGAGGRLDLLALEELVKRTYIVTSTLNIDVTGTPLVGFDPEKSSEIIIPKTEELFTPLLVKGTTYNYSWSKGLDVTGSAHSQFLDYLYEIRLAEDEELLLGDYIDQDLISKIEIIKYFNERSESPSTRLEIKFDAEVEGSNSWLQRLYKEDEELFFSLLEDE